ncbi:MAG: aminotransferase class I/II-fold pyridoxal phosphate-dependent enzyme [Lachnospiraceae bacterium]|nr:aminotransferase class I/II-fold pyridoxal phosphate-dependent enzyme [Lachnospiraceae bacterium]
MEMHHGGDVYGEVPVLLDLSVNLNPLGTPPEILAVLKDEAEKVSLYPDLQCRELRSRLSESEKIPANQIICGCGASELISLLIQCIHPGHVLLPVPAYTSYERAIRDIGQEPVYYRLKKNNGFALTSSFLPVLKAFSHPQDMLILCNPNNPTGRLTDRSLLCEIASLCREKQVFLLLDECFLSLCENEETSLKDQLEDNPYLFVLDSFTKKYAMPGLRLGMMYSSNTMILERMQSMKTEWSVSTLSQRAGIAALSLSGQYLSEAKGLIKKEKEFLTKNLVNLGFTVFPSDTCFILFYNESRPDLSSRLAEKGILIRDCRDYSGLSPGFYRIAVRSHEASLLLLQALNGF